MKNVISIVAICAIMFGTFSVQADEYCKYDVIGDFLTPIQVGQQPGVYSSANFPQDGLTSLHPNFWQDDLFGCYEAYLNPGWLYYFPRCDRDGSGLVETTELFDLWGFMNAMGPTYTIPCYNGCYDLAAIDFNAGTGSSSPLGAALIDGNCSMIFGNFVPNGVDLYANTAECEAACTGCNTNDDCDASEYCHFEDYTCGDAGNGSCVPRGEVCSSIYDPICSCDYTIVSNACMATVMGASILSDGECAQEDVCNYNGGVWNGTDCDCPAGTEFNYQRGCESVAP